MIDKLANDFIEIYNLIDFSISQISYITLVPSVPTT